MRSMRMRRMRKMRRMRRMRRIWGLGGMRRMRRMRMRGWLTGRLAGWSKWDRAGSEQKVMDLRSLYERKRIVFEGVAGWLPWLVG